ncbi:MAG: hypothetical protein VYE73_16905 [Acidobacteriota bacterium]|nr:hypothetical protein [Acidobacteriota bacterium]
MHPRLLRSAAEGQDAFTDVLFNALLGFVFMFVVAFALMSDPDRSGDIDTNAQMLITVRWPDEHPDDVDAVVEDPRGALVWYHNQETEVMHLDRDDRGTFFDTFVVDGREISNPINQETVSIRTVLPGEYVVNLLHYKANTAEPVEVTLKIERLNPRVEVVYYGDHQLSGTGEEITAVRFVVNAEGTVTSLSHVPKDLLARAVKDRTGA